VGAKINWHSIRHSAATWAEAEGMTMSNRQALMGHAAASMTQRYTHEDLARQAAGVEQIAEKLCGGGEMAAAAGQIQ
jgi:integrase